MAPIQTIRNVAVIRRRIRVSVSTLERNKKLSKATKHDLMQTAIIDLLTADVYILRALRVLQKTRQIP